MHGLVLIDDGKAISPFYSWQDLRSIGFLPGVQERLPKFNFHHETGEYLRAGFPILQLVALKSEGLCRGTICDLGNAVVQALSGKKYPSLEVTNAAATGAWDIQNAKWHSLLIREMGLNVFDWPEVVDRDEKVGFWEYQGERIPIFTSIGDQQISLLGAGLLRSDQACFNIATGSQVSRLVSDATPGEFQIRPYFDNRYIRTITHIPAGRALNRLLTLFAEMNPALDLEQAWESLSGRIDTNEDRAISLPEVDLSFFPSAFGGEGSISHLTEANLNVVSIMRGALVSLTRMQIQSLERLAVGQTRVSEFLGAGGILRKSKYLRELFRNQIGQELSLPQVGEDALLGHLQRFRNLSLN
jgi:sugar (pentulose or hexulose) kinase